LTVWDLQQDGISATLVADNMGEHFLKSGRIGVHRGGRRPHRRQRRRGQQNRRLFGDCAGKENEAPFFVAAPISTLDLSLASGDGIPIEQRSAAEVTSVLGHPIVPETTAGENPAFDVTRARYITAIILESGVARPPFPESLTGARGPGARNRGLSISASRYHCAVVA
jgi:methylthioribose-1-phosphate isomerase